MPKAYRKRRVRRPFRFRLFSKRRSRRSSYFRLFSKRRSRKSSYLRLFLKRPPYVRFAYIALGCIICLSIVLAWSGMFKGTSQKESSTGQESMLALRYRVTGEPSIDAAFINSVLKHYHSPASGAGEAFYEQGVKYGIDPVFALAFFMEESTFGTKGVARVTHSLGNIRATPGYHSYHGYRSYKSWTEGSEDWYRLIAQLYVKRWRLTTVDQIIPIYAPGRDRNNPTGYIHNVKQAVDRWRSGIITI